MANDIKRQLTRIAKDKQVTPEEWKKLKPTLEKTPAAANPTARAVLDLWADDSLRVHVDAQIGIRNYLVSRGYPVPDVDEPTPALVPGIVAGNVTEADTDFERLFGLLENPKQTTLIGVLDSGFAFDHPALKEKLWTNKAEVPRNGKDDDGNGFVDDVVGWDFVANKSTPIPEQHGTHVTGIATRGTNRVKAIPLRVTHPLDGNTVANGIDLAAKHGARVINMSIPLGKPADTALVKAAIERHPHILFVKSAGNDGQALGTGAYAPGTYLSAEQLPNMVVVAAANADGSRADYTNYGAPYATVAARGTDVLSTITDGRYFHDDGTSMATPETTALVAKCLALDPELTPAQLKHLLLATTAPRPDWKDAVAAGGLIANAEAMRVAALTGLLRKGIALEAAALKLGLSAQEQASLGPIAALTLAIEP